MFLYFFIFHYSFNFARKKQAALAGGKGKKKKWSKGKVKEKLMNLVLIDKATFDKLMKEIPKVDLFFFQIFQNNKTRNSKPSSRSKKPSLMTSLIT